MPVAGSCEAEAMLFDGQIVPPELVPSFRQVLATANGLHKPRAPTSIHQVLQNNWIPTARSLDGPTPRQNLEMLRNHGVSGADVGIVLDEVMQGRMGNVLAETSCTTYTSHTKLVLKFCLMLRAVPLPAERSTVLRFIGLFNNAKTLRGALAAWRQVHIRCHVHWVLEGDVFCSMLQRAVRRSMAARFSLRKPEAIRLVLHAVEKGGQWLGIAAIIALAYVFGLRVPSELLRQSRADLWWLGAHAIHYGPIGRKHRHQPVTLMRGCIANRHQFCAHMCGPGMKRGPAQC